VMSGLGVSMLSEHTLTFGGSTGLVKLDVQELPIMTHWYLANLTAKPLSVIARTFLDYIAATGKESLIQELYR